MKKELIAQKMGEILEILGLDLTDPLIANTPKRVAQMYVDEIFDGIDPNNFPTVTHFEQNSTKDEVITIRDIAFVSFCAHHLIPMMGRVTISYIPQHKLLGFSKIHDIVRFHAHRPQLQERLTEEIATSIATLLEIEDIAVTCTATHFCVVARKGEDQSSTVETSLRKGVFKLPQNVAGITEPTTCTTALANTAPK